MLATQRQDRILAALRDHGAVRIADLVRDLDVSDMTVRRDLAELAERGLARKVHGGAVLPDAGQATTHEPGFAAKSALAADEKRAIAAAAAGLVRPGSSVAVSAGTTTYLLAAAIAADPALRPLTVVTNSLPVADVLHRAATPGDGLEVVLTGGSRTPSDALVGPLAEAALAGLRVDQAFLGAHGVSAEAGCTTPNLDEAATDRALLRSAARTVLLADRSKWTVTGLRVFARLDEIDVLVTDDGLPADDLARARALAGSVVVAPAAAPAPRTPRR